MSENTQDQLPAPVDFAQIDQEDYQNRQADRIAAAVFNGEDNAEKTGNLIQQFVASYVRHKDELPLDDWLTAEFRKYPTIWKDEAEIAATAREIIASVQDADAAKESLYAHLDQGKSRESWLARQIERGAAATGVTQIGLYAEYLSEELQQANLKSFDALFNQKPDIVGDWEVSANPHLHGFIAETDVANQFNLNASASLAGVSAEVVGSTGLNSADLVIRDAAGNVLEDVQLKSYADVEQAVNNIRSHGYADGTTLLVHEDQVDRLQREFPNLKVTSELKAGGVSAAMPSHARLKQLQHDAQLREESRQYQWNDVNRIDIAKGIGKQALVVAGIGAAFQGARILGRRVWNTLNGRDNPPASEDLKAFFESSIKTGGHIGARVAVSGAVVVAVKSGWLGRALMGTPAGRIVNMVYVGMENAKVLYKLAKGELTTTETLNAMGNTTCSVVGGLYGARLGMAQGAAIGSVLGPVGTVVGGFVGGIVGSMAGSKIGEAVYAAGRTIVKTAAKVLKTAYEGVKEAARAFARALNPLAWFA